MSDMDVHRFFIAALRAELAKRGHGCQSELAKRTEISKSAVNDIVKGRSQGSDRNRRTIAKALGYNDFEEFLDVGRKLLGISPVRPAGVDRQAIKVSSNPDLVELLIENRQLRIELEKMRAQNELLRQMPKNSEHLCGPSDLAAAAAGALKSD